MTNHSHFVYILQAGNGHYYTGYTTDLARRLEQHKKGQGAKFTKAFGAKKILYHEVFDNKSAALKRECQIKKLTRAQKIKLIQKNDGDHYQI